VVGDYLVTIEGASAVAGEFAIEFTASGISDIYRSTDLENFGSTPIATDVVTGSFVDDSAPAGKVFYLIQEAGSAAP
jgi:hypothetical protein